METIKKNEFSILTYFLTRCFYTGIAIHNIIFLAKQDSWISIIIAFIIGFIPMILFNALLNIEPSLSIIQLTKKYCGKVIGTIINIIFIASILFHASIVLWNLSNFINSQFLFKTPVLVISILFMIPIIYTVSKGLKTIGRTSVVLFLMSIVIYLISFLSLVGKVKLDNLFPMFEFGINPILDGALIEISYCVLAIYPLLIIPKDNINENGKLSKSLFKFYIFNIISMFTVMLFIITIFGYPLANLYQYSEFHILKTINIANFFQRVESILSFQFLFDLAIGLMVFVYFTKNAIEQTFNVNKKFDKIILLIICIAIVYLSTIIFKNNTIAYDFLGKTYKYVRVIVLFLIPLIIYIIARIRKK